MKRIADLLEKVRLHRVAFRLYEARAARGAGADRGFRAPDGLPVPPPELLVKVTGTPDPEQFIRTGALAAAAIRDAMQRQAAPVGSMEAILDFGCGCGRVLRHWRTLAAEVHGSDYNQDLTNWCSANLPFSRIASNRLAPPLSYPDARFDLIYALSVITHLSEPLQDAWMAELYRVLRPGGHLLITTHGAFFADRLTPPERDRLQAGERVTRYGSASGTNFCSTYHPESYVRKRLSAAANLEVVQFVPEGALGNPGQDLYLLRRPLPSR
jgi:SAM-dependent methyltransferase